MELFLVRNYFQRADTLWDEFEATMGTPVEISHYRLVGDHQRLMRRRVILKEQHEPSKMVAQE